MIFLKVNQPVILHLSELFGKSGSFQIEVVSHLLAIERNIELRGSFLYGHAVQVGHDAISYGFRGSVKTPAGKHQILMSGDCKEVAHDFCCP